MIEDILICLTDEVLKIAHRQSNVTKGALT